MKWATKKWLEICGTVLRFENPDIETAWYYADETASVWFWFDGDNQVLIAEVG